MKGSEAKMIEYMEGAGKRYVIPVYQRKYDWKEENCRQLYEDLKKIVRDNRESHFFGSIVSSVVGNGASTEYHIIDGQQRLTTITLLLLAIRNLIRQKRSQHRKIGWTIRSMIGFLYLPGRKRTIKSNCGQSRVTVIPLLNCLAMRRIMIRPLI